MCKAETSLNLDSPLAGVNSREPFLKWCYHKTKADPLIIPELFRDQPLQPMMNSNAFNLMNDKVGEILMEKGSCASLLRLRTAGLLRVLGLLDCRRSYRVDSSRVTLWVSRV